MNSNERGIIRRTPLYKAHKELGGKMVNFSGWELPVYYGSQKEEHKSVREHAGIFDVSHMTVIDVSGIMAMVYLQKLLANDVHKLNTSGQAQYSIMLNENGGVIDDLIVYYLSENHYRLVVNSATKAKDLSWMVKQADMFNVTITPQPELAIIALQGPEAISIAKAILQTNNVKKLDSIKPFTSTMIDDIFFARTGYTGEDGLELIMAATKVESVWNKLVEKGATPCGLGARDTLRLEAGLNLYGSEMDEQINPLEANLGWCIAWKPEGRDFIGRAIVEKARHLTGDKLVGVIMKERGILRAGQKLCLQDNRKGVITSGTFSPTLGYSIALARIPADAITESAKVDIRRKLLPVVIGSPRFVRKGKKIFKAFAPLV